MKKTIFTILAIAALSFANAQHSVQYDKESGIEQIEQQHQSAWKSIDGIEGFRIQIAAASGVNSKNTVQRAYEEFRSRFPEIPAYVTYAEPYFRLRIGNFRTRLEATATLEKIKGNYPGAYIIKDEIKFK
ncbi:MAG: SPOR domain-containing protein [Bacteroidales bacterium]|nr:SPOR domain-containing protein [Bacteroidales bacterium]